ncbi:hypothetical protein [Lentilitoribacter sp. Alg239-R112]|uniref:hypothetical protein n=1 Tax=Lentilitoribacter sp. Alg239-R112 TaxID=2305987 RepID=UPI0013A6C93B|nr:hypothetical protein [Lentilitoribacter sp. Alg239-R112]
MSNVMINPFGPIVLATVVLASLIGSAKSDTKIIYKRLTIERSEDGQKSLFDIVLVGETRSRNVAVLNKEGESCNLEIWDMVQRMQIVRFSDFRYCKSDEYEDAYSLYNLPEFEPFFATNSSVITLLLKSYDIDPYASPLDEFDVDSDGFCSSNGTVMVCGNSFDIR